MDISPTTAATSAATAPQPASEEASPSIEADFETFLNLLTAQLRNQDPLNPADSTEFVAQLAQFSGVEQQVKSNNTLESILEALGGGGASLGAFLGTEVLAADALEFRGDPIALSVEPAATATTASLVVRDEQGRVVERVSVDPQARDLTWNGAGADDGFYTFTVERSASDGPLDDAIAKGFSPVVEARLTEAGTVLVLAGGAEVNQTDITAVRTPQG